MLWAYDRGTSKMLKYDLDGHFLYAWGVWGDFPGGFWGVHGFSVDQEGNFYVAEVDSGRVQKFRPAPGRQPGTAGRANRSTPRGSDQLSRGAAVNSRPRFLA